MTLSPDQSVRIAGRELNVRVEGEGPAVLLIHGIPSNHSLWRDVIPRLSGRARVIAPDLLGYGLSDAPRGRPVDIVSQAEYMNELLDVLGINNATIVGHDIGGGVAQILATQYGARVERLALINSVCYDSWPVPELRALQATSPVIDKLPPGLTTGGLQMGLKRGFVHQERADDFLEDFLQPFSTEEGMRVFLELANSLDSEPTRDLAPKLRELQMPVDVIWGKMDTFQPPELAERLVADIPTAELTWIQDASHFSPADAPDAVADALERLLDRPVSAPPE